MDKIEKALYDINPNYKIIKRFEKGMSNYTFLVLDENNNKFVYRYPGEHNDEFVNYKELYKNLKEIEKLQITNELIYYNEENGIKISKYIEGQMIDRNKDIPKVVETFKKIHLSSLKLCEYKHLTRLEKYESIAKNNNEKYFDCKNKWLRIYNSILKEHIVYPTHGDSQLSNIVVADNKEIKLLDFEFSAINDYIYDIAAFGNDDFEDALQLLNAYEDEINSDKLKRLYGWRIFQCLQWYNVALYKNNIGLSEKFNIDFLKISDNYLKKTEFFLINYEEITK